MYSILFGLSSAISWGAADFCGGLASRKAKPHQAVLLGEAFGLLLLLAAAFFTGEEPLSWLSLLFCALAGGMGVLGLLLFFHALSAGRMTVAAPVSALTATLLPIIVGSLLDGLPGFLTFAGFLLALLAIWLISSPDGMLKDLHLRFKDLTLPLIAGVSFGFYLVLMNLGSQEQFLLPVVTSRASGTLTMLTYSLIARKRVNPAAQAWPFILLNGLLDVTGNALYILAGQAGRMDIAAVLASLYPASTVLLAWLILRERINRPQGAGILAALAAIVLMTI